MTFGAEEIVDLQPQVDNVGQVASQKIMMIRILHWPQSMSFEFWGDYQMMRIRCRLQVPSLSSFIPITYPTGLMWAPNGEEVNLWQNWEKNSRRKESCPLYHLLQVSQSREQVSTASVAIIQVPIYHGGNDTNWWQLYRYVPIYQGGIDTHWLAIISIGGNI